jgi:hypothetical protein
MGVKEIIMVVVGEQPYIVDTVNAYLVNAVGGQHGTPVVGCPEGSELVAVIAAKSVPGGYPHQPMTVLCHTGNVVGRQSGTRIECLHVAIVLPRHGKGITAGKYR